MKLAERHVSYMDNLQGLYQLCRKTGNNQQYIAVHAPFWQQCMHTTTFQSNSQCLQGMMIVKASTSQAQVAVQHQCGHDVSAITCYALVQLSRSI